jgi:hypothetical protein
MMLVIIVLLVYIHAHSSCFARFSAYHQYFRYAYVIFCAGFIGLRPSGENGYTDTLMYQQMFEYAQIHHSLSDNRDVGFYALFLLSSYIINFKIFLLLCSTLSFGILLIISKKIAKEKWFVFFMATCASLYFFDYQVYTIRQGLACLLLLLAMVYPQKSIKIPLLVVSVLFHKSLLLPVLAYAACSIYTNSLCFALLYLLSIPVSYFSGQMWEQLLAKFIPDERVVYLTGVFNDSKMFLRTGFRVDIIIFNLMVIAIGLYHQWVKKYSNKTYNVILNTYIICSVAITLIIRANNIHRFAYLAWCLIPIIVLYPLLHKPKINQNNTYQKLSAILIGFTCFIICYKLIKSNF